MGAKQFTGHRRPRAAAPTAPASKATGRRKTTSVQARARIDWCAVERDYRTGAFTDRELGAKYGCSHAAVGKRARNGAWQKNLAGAVLVATRAKLIEAELQRSASAEVASAVAKQVASAIPATIEVVGAIAAVNSAVVLRQRGDLAALRNEADSLLTELTWQRENLPALETMLSMVCADNPLAGPAMRAAFARAVGLAGRVGNLKALADVHAKVIPLERVAFGLDEAEQEDRTLVEQLQEMSAKPVPAHAALPPGADL